MRKLLCTVAAVAMPAAALAGITAVGGSGVAGATKTYTSQVCAITGGVTFAAPGLSFGGSLAKKSTVTSVSSATATGTGCGVGTGTTTTLTNKITTAATDCLTAPAPLPGACAGATSKLHYAYSNASNLATAGVASIVASLSKGLKVVDNGNKVTAAVTAAGTHSVLPTSLGGGGECGAGTGFELSGNTNVSGLTYALLLCFTGDTGTNTTNAFFTDYLGAAGGGNQVIQTGVFGGNAALFLFKA